MATQDQHDDLPDLSAEDLGIGPIREELEDELNPIELDMYEDWRLEFARWAFDRGKDTTHHDGYSPKSLYNIMYRVERFAAWLFDKEGFTTDFSADQLDAYWTDVLTKNDNAKTTNRRTINNVALILKMQGKEYSIPDSTNFYRKVNKETASGFTDYFTVPELSSIRQASLRAYAVPDKDSLSADERDEWAATLAQRIGTAKENLTEDDWSASYKIPSLVYLSVDVGFRPTEIEESNLSWLRLDDDDDARIQIPKDEDSKDGKNNWRCLISPETARLLQMWLKERKTIEMYNDSDAIWLTREENPYTSSSLRGVMQNLMDEAGIDRTYREQGWYMIRRGVGTEIGNEKGLYSVMSQLRINNIDTARRYVQNGDSAARDWLDSRW